MCWQSAGCCSGQHTVDLTREASLCVLAEDRDLLNTLISVYLCFVCQLFRFQQPVMSLETPGFQKVFGSQATFWVAYSFMPMSEQCPDGLVMELVESSRFVEILGVFKGVSVGRVEDLIDVQVLFIKSDLF